MFVLVDGLVLPPGLVFDPGCGPVLLLGLVFAPEGGLALAPGLVPGDGLVPGWASGGGLVLVPGLVLVLGDGLVAGSVFAPGFGAEFVPGLVLGFPAPVLGLVLGFPLPRWGLVLGFPALASGLVLGFPALVPGPVLGFTALVPGPVSWPPFVLGFWSGVGLVVLLPPWFPVLGSLLGGVEPVAGVLSFVLPDEPAGLLPGECGAGLLAGPFAGALLVVGSELGALFAELGSPVEGELAPPGAVSGWEPFAELELVAGAPVDGLPFVECASGVELGVPGAEFEAPPVVEPLGEFWLPGELLAELVSGEVELFWSSL